MTDLLTINRRAMLGQLAALLGVAALPAEALAKPASRAAARHLGRRQYALLGAIADTILPTTDTPGAVAAGVPAKLDGMLRDWASASTRAEMAAAMQRIDDAAMTAKRKRFVSLRAADRETVLRAHDAAALKPAAPPAGAPPSHPFAQKTWVADNAYLALKGLIVTLYYYSETGSQNELEYLHMPGTWQPSLTLTPQSRPYLGLGPF